MASAIPQTDEELLQQWLDGYSPVLMGELLNRFRHGFISYVKKRLHGDFASKIDPEDIVADAYLEALRRVGEYLDKKPIPFRPWLLRIVTDHLARSQRAFLGTKQRDLTRECRFANSTDQSSKFASVNILAASITSPSSKMARGEIQELLNNRVREAVERLSETDIQIYELRYQQGLSNREVATFLGIGEAAAGMRYARLNKRLTHLLKDLSNMVK